MSKSDQLPAHMGRRETDRVRRMTVFLTPLLPPGDTHTDPDPLCLLWILWVPLTFMVLITLFNEIVHNSAKCKRSKDEHSFHKK